MKRTLYIILGVLIASVAISACEEKTPVFEYKAISKTAKGEKLVTKTDMVAEVYVDTTYTITKGATATEFAYLSMSTGLTMKLFVFEVDLSNPEIGIEVSTPENMPAFKVQPMTTQAIFEDTEGHKVWGGVNGDFFASNGTPQGIVYKNGAAIKTTFTDATNTFFAITKEKKAIIGGQDIYNELKPTIQEALGGRVWLVRNGIKINNDNAAVEPRTCVGITEDGQKVYLLAVDGRNFWHSNGMSYDELSKCMQAFGAYQAINLDGGGSTTFFIRNTTEFTADRFELKNWPCDKGGQERAVANGLIIIGK